MKQNLQWHCLTINPKAIEAIYDEVPTLEEISILEIKFDRNASSISIQFDLPVYPKTPPKKWQEQGYNKVSLCLNFIETSKAKLNGWGSEIIGTIEIIKNETVFVMIKSDVLNLEFQCEFIDISQITAYYSLK